jgi:NAD(P)-dependent dehydrogenase (short-subunit alcohol dehydrogenase family)
MHRGGRSSLDGLTLAGGGSVSYSDSKLFVTTLAATLARRWPDVLINSVDPGWVATRMGGPGASDDLELGHVTQVWLAVSSEPEALTTGGYWYHQGRQHPHPAVRDGQFQDELMAVLEHLTGLGIR